MVNPKIGTEDRLRLGPILIMSASVSSASVMRLAWIVDSLHNRWRRYGSRTVHRCSPGLSGGRPPDPLLDGLGILLFDIIDGQQTGVVFRSVSEDGVGDSPTDGVAGIVDLAIADIRETDEYRGR